MISIPFSGSKKTSYKYVKPIVEKFNYRSVYEPFGGSGVLSVNLYKDGLVDRAVVNDYDRFFDDYEKYLDYKDWIVEKCEQHGLEKTTSCKEYGCYKRVNGQVVQLDTKLLPADQKAYLQSLVKQIPQKYWRYLALGGNFCFSGAAQKEVVPLSEFRYFSSELTTTRQREYLKNLKNIEVCSLDYKEFLKIYSSDFGYDTLLIIDPPYIGTSQTGYKGQFDLEDTKELIELLKKYKIDFIFFNDNPELINELLDGLNIVDKNDVVVSGTTNIKRNERKDYFALVQF